MALRLTHTTLGDRLFDAATSMTPSQLIQFVNLWRIELQRELQLNISGFLDRKAPAAAKAITDEFPESDAIYAYTAPAVSSVLPELWEKRFDISRLVLFMKDNLNWSEDLILKRLTTQVITGAVVSHLLEIIRVGVSTSDRQTVLLSIEKERNSKTLGRLEYSVKVSTRAIFENLPMAFDNVKSQLPTLQELWIQVDLLRRTVPSIVDTYTNSKSCSIASTNAISSKPPSSPVQTESSTPSIYIDAPQTTLSPRDNTPSSGTESLPDPHELIQTLWKERFKE